MNSLKFLINHTVSLTSEANTRLELFASVRVTFKSSFRTLIIYLHLKSLSDYHILH